MGGARSATKEGDEDVDGKDNERGAYESFADGIEVVGKSEMQKDNRSPQDCDRDGVSERIKQPKPHSLTPGALHTSDVRDGSEVVVVEAVTQPEQGAGDESEFKG